MHLKVIYQTTHLQMAIEGWKNNAEVFSKWIFIEICVLQVGLETGVCSCKSSQKTENELVIPNSWYSS